MSVFNSLGSNYDFNFAIKALIGTGKTDLKKILEKKYNGQAALLFKGREAITLALKNLNLPKDSQIAINGLTCYAVYRAIEETECKPVLIDVPKDDLNFTAKSLREKISPKTKVVIVQNTLGYPCDIEEIAKFCKDKNLILIEDLAHSVGTIYKNGKKAGTVGDMVIFSFSQDKIIDGVSGGALITRNSKLKAPASQRGEQSSKFSNPSLSRQIKDRLYPILTWKIKITYDWGIGKLFHFNLKKLNLLSAPMDESLYEFVNLPDFYKNLIQKSFSDLELNLDHRKKIAQIYANNLGDKIIWKNITNNIQSSSNLRFPIFVNSREDLIRYLKEEKFYFSDIWYDAPIAPKRFMSKIGYRNNCPNAEKISEKILNLPTHKNISEEQATRLANLINQWSEQAKRGSSSA